MKIRGNRFDRVIDTNVKYLFQILDESVLTRNSFLMTARSLVQFWLKLLLTAILFQVCITFQWISNDKPQSTNFSFVLTFRTTAVSKPSTHSSYNGHKCCRQSTDITLAAEALVLLALKISSSKLFFWLQCNVFSKCWRAVLNKASLQSYSTLNNYLLAFVFAYIYFLGCSLWCQVFTCWILRDLFRVCGVHSIVAMQAVLVCLSSLHVRFMQSQCPPTRIWPS